MFLNLGCGNRPIKDEGWVNVDKFDNVGADQVVDLFKMPYPWLDNSIEGILCSHFLEHIPHSLVPHNMDTFPWSGRQLELLKLDGFFAFFEECYRILKPGGYIEIECPFGWSTGAFQDPTHTRYIVLQTFGYLHRDEAEKDKPFDYGLRADFIIKEANHAKLELGGGDWVAKGNHDILELQVDANINAIRNIRIILTANK